jgi:hypothetical protein
MCQCQSTTQRSCVAILIILDDEVFLDKRSRHNSSAKIEPTVSVAQFQLFDMQLETLHQVRH